MKIIITTIEYHPIMGRYWFFYFKRYKFVKGVNITLFGVHIKITELYATEKLIALARKKANLETP